MKPSALLAYPVIATLALATAIPPPLAYSAVARRSPINTNTRADEANPPASTFRIYYAAGFNPWRTPIGYIVRTSDGFPDDKNCPDRIENLDPETREDAFPEQGILVGKDRADGTNLLEINVKDVGHYRIREAKKKADGDWRLEDRHGRSAGHCKRLTTGSVSRCQSSDLKWIVQLHYDCTVTSVGVDAAAEVAAVGVGA